MKRISRYIVKNKAGMMRAGARLYSWSYFIAWLTYLGFITGPFLHQRIFHGSFRIDGCFIAMTLFPWGLCVTALVGFVVAALIMLPLAAAASTFRPGTIVRFVAGFIAVCVLVSFSLTTGDASIERGCF